MRIEITPLYDRIVCKRVEAAAFTKEAGLFIPEAARERPQEAVVIAVGGGKRSEHTASFMPPLVAIGDHVLIGKYAGAEVSVGDEMYLVLREDEVLGTVTLVEEDEKKEEPDGE